MALDLGNPFFYLFFFRKEKKKLQPVDTYQVMGSCNLYIYISIFMVIHIDIPPYSFCNASRLFSRAFPENVENYVENYVSKMWKTLHNTWSMSVFF